MLWAALFLGLGVAAGAEAKTEAPNIGFFAPRIGEIVVLRADADLKALVAADNDLPGDVAVRELFGKPVLAYFWGPAAITPPGARPMEFCSECAAVSERMQRLHERYALKGLEVVGLGIDGHQVASSSASVYTHLIGGYRGGAVASLGLKGIPSWVLIDRRGMVFAKGDAPMDWDKISLNVEALLAGRKAVKFPPLAPNLGFQAYRSGDWVALRDDGRDPGTRVLAGRPVLLHFWKAAEPDGPESARCPRCPEELEQMERLHETFALRGLQVASISYYGFETTKKAADAFSHMIGDYEGDVSALFGLETLPAWVLLDEQGRIVESASAPFDWPRLKRQVERLLESKAPLPPPPPKARGRPAAERAPDFSFVSARSKEIVLLREDDRLHLFLERRENKRYGDDLPVRVLAGSTVLAYFWDAGGESRAAMEAMERLHVSHALAGLRVAGIGIEEPPDAEVLASSFTHLLGYSLDARTVHEAYGFRDVPAWALIGRDGSVLARGEDTIDWKALEGRVRDALQAKAPR